MPNRLEINEIGRNGLSSPSRFSHNGYSGGAQTKGYSVKSTSLIHAYTNLTVSINKVGNQDIQGGADFFTDSGWSIKLLAKETSDYPTEREWGEVFPMTSIPLNNIGDVDENTADNVTTQYFFVRVFCPGHSDPGQYEHKISLTYNSINLTGGVI